MRSTTLSNGMTVITDDMPHLESASLGIWVWLNREHLPDALVAFLSCR